MSEYASKELELLRAVRDHLLRDQRKRMAVYNEQVRYIKRLERRRPGAAVVKNGELVPIPEGESWYPPERATMK